MLVTAAPEPRLYIGSSILVSSTLSGPMGNTWSPTSNVPSDGGVIFRGHGRRGAGLGWSREHAGPYD